MSHQGPVAHQGLARTPYSASPARVADGDESVGQLMGRLSGDLSRLVHDELELAKVEIKDEVAKGGKVAGMFGATGVAALLALVLCSFAAAWGLAEVIAPGWAFLAVGSLYAAAAGVLFLTGRRRLSEVRPLPEQTIETLKEDVQWARAQKH